ncbi:MAG: ATP-dependent sacrificial sulfur transferase LarE [Planctomycetota bacterium]
MSSSSNNKTDKSVKRRINKLHKILSEMESAVVAFSGGVDSSLLLSFACEIIGDRVLAVTAVSPTYPNDELRIAKQIAKKTGVELVVINTNELKDKRFSENPPDRCYFCKLNLFSKLRDIAKRNKIKHILDGSNIDDMKDYRPGRKAAKEFNVRSPLQEAGLTKKDIRQLAKKRDLPNWNKEPLACLASRFPYKAVINAADLKQVDNAEKFLRQLGFTNIRVRHHGTVARIEVSDNQITKLSKPVVRKKVTENLRKFGYEHITVDLQGYRTGSFNKGLKQ